MTPGKNHVAFVAVEFALLVGNFHTGTLVNRSNGWLLILLDLLSFFVVMLQRLKLPANLDGMVWHYANPAGANRRHHHAELELNLVTQGSGTYLLGNRHYQIRRGDLLWLFPAQEHVLIEQTSDFEMWIVVFRRRLIKRSATDPASLPLQQRSFYRGHLPPPASPGPLALRRTLRAARRHSRRTRPSERRPRLRFTACVEVLRSCRRGPRTQRSSGGRARRASAARR